jgi:hypothetical protein
MFVGFSGLVVGFSGLVVGFAGMASFGLFVAMFRALNWLAKVTQ